ncbi:transcriptional repressor NF-X1-like [Actinia tenebrosa]|uniref:Transcriptional repressor NF-X1-like n=1 Tax=Actinia tenebrosa TaxID=6105 RepID=A0A6P8H8P8_ACTTE|nr:transcriptional repressor NF-X1-like [Actinia tenebrosa]
MEAEGPAGEPPSEQDETERNGARNSEKSDETSEKEKNLIKTKSNQRRPYTSRQRKEFQGKTKDSKREQQCASKGDSIDSQKTLDDNETEGNKDVISWLNKRMSKKEDSSSGERNVAVDVKDKPRDEGRNKSQKFIKRKDKKFVGKESIKSEEQEQPSQGVQVLSYKSSENEKSKQRSRMPRNKNPNFRSETKNSDSWRGRQRSGKLSSREERDKHQELDKKDSIVSADENVIEIGTNVNVVNGKYVGRREKQENRHDYSYDNQFSGTHYYPQDYYYQQGFPYGGVYGVHLPVPYDAYFQPYGMEFNNAVYCSQYQDYGNVNQNFYQGYQPQNQEQFENHSVTVTDEDEKSKPRNNKRQRYPFKGYRNRQIIGNSNVIDASHSEQAGMLTEQLQNESYECMVCCDKIYCSAAVWSCDNCYHVFHLKCARKWARSPMAVIEGEDGGWRCPACQNISQSVPNVYRCFCGKSLDPPWNVRDGITPHSCGELCKKKRDAADCPHLCNQLCHPGPCPSCPVMVSKSCECGKESQQSRCGQKIVIKCKSVCRKPLNCGVHTCEKICHSGPCDLCDVSEEQVCYCGATKRQALCGSGDIDIVDGKNGCFSCENTCNRTLDCGNHTCDAVCHKGDCAPCKLKPELIVTCPCGKTTLSQLLGTDGQRESCLDPVPTCEKTCGKILPCSPKEGDKSNSSSEHRCKEPCHHGNCGPCDGVSVVVCRCGAATKIIKCCERTTEDYLCDQRCNKKRQCGRHRCNQKCCVNKDHKCELICGKKLRCGIHTCDEPCHRGYCPPCFMTSFEELSCHCGATVLFPPIPCGTPPPDCTKPCSRQHPCSHQVNHLCHNEEVCPPCTVLTKKMCSGNHELRLNVQCHVTDVSCGKRCGSILPCGHKCINLCHKPPCVNDQEPCTQPCNEPRKECGHICGAPCHKGTPCPVLPCKVKVKVSCKCGRRSEMVPCLQGGDKSALAQFYQRLTTETLANKMKEVQQGQTVDIARLMMLDDKATKHIDCNEECAVQERNRRFAEALHIDESTEAALNVPRMLYSSFLVNEAKSNIAFIQSVEEAFENIIDIAKKSQSGQKSHSFPPMKSNQRRIIHELAVHYNCSSISYYSEPKRNTVITATKESKVPPSTLSAQVNRLVNPPAPTPVPYLPSDLASKTRLTKKTNEEEKPKAWSQVPDYFADDFDD